MPDGTFAVADALQNLRIVQDGFNSAAEAEKFIEDSIWLGVSSGHACRSTRHSGRHRHFGTIWHRLNSGDWHFFEQRRRPLKAKEAFGRQFSQRRLPPIWHRNLP
jgi:hypothetical protein